MDSFTFAHNNEHNVKQNSSIRENQKLFHVHSRAFIIALFPVLHRYQIMKTLKFYVLNTYKGTNKYSESRYAVLLFLYGKKTRSKRGSVPKSSKSFKPTNISVYNII